MTVPLSYEITLVDGQIVRRHLDHVRRRNSRPSTDHDFGVTPSPEPDSVAEDTSPPLQLPLNPLSHLQQLDPLRLNLLQLQSKQRLKIPHQLKRHQNLFKRVVVIQFESDDTQIDSSLTSPID